MLSKDEFIDFILKGPEKLPASAVAAPEHSALPEGFEGFDATEDRSAAAEASSTFARRLLEASGFGYPDLAGRDTVIRSSDAVARYLPDRVSFWPKTPSRPYQTLLFETPLTNRQLLEVPAFRGRKMNHLDIVEDALARLVSEALEGFQRGGESVTADVRKGRKEETLCVISIVDEREGEPVRLVCFGTQNKITGGLETFQITERTRFWDGALAREHLGLVYERQFKKLATENWQEAFTTTEERKQAEKLVDICTRKAPKEVDIQEGVLDLLDTIAKGFGLRRKPNTERRLQAFALPPDHDIGIDPDERAAEDGGRNPFGGVTLRDERNRLLGYIVYPLTTKNDAGLLRKHLAANNRFHNVLVVYPEQDEANFELWQGRDQLTGKLRKGQGFRDAAEIVNLLSRFFVVSKAKVRNPTELAQELAYRARYLRRLAVKQLGEEQEKGPLRNLYNAFKEALVHDQTEDEFADAFAQTVTYGLLAARWVRNDQLVAEGERFTRQTALKHLPAASPFLNDLFKSTLSVRLDEQRGRLLWLVDDISDLLDRIDVSYVFGAGDAASDSATDPVIHFYEPFLAAYDKDLKNKRGVFFTPKPVVSYIVRSVHELLQKEFGLEDGLASTDTWGDVSKRQPGLTIPLGVKPTDPFVCILDPATGTGTFLFECIEIIEHTFKDKCCRTLRKDSWSDPTIIEHWNKYVSTHLLPRLYAYELMMASYAVAHLKLSFKLSETGYHIRPGDRLNVFLTNSLEPPSDSSQEKLAGTFPALAHEAAAVNAIKRHQRFTVVIGNPPYANFGKLNKITFILDLLGDYKRGLDERKINLDDDFIKFIRYGQYLLQMTGVGVLGFITNNVFLDGITHRRMRQSLLDFFTLLRVVDLHGSIQKRELAPDGTPDENVFDIKQGVAVSVLARTLHAVRHPLHVTDMYGDRSSKYERLSGPFRERAGTAEISPEPPQFFFKPSVNLFRREYERGWSVPAMMPFYNSGIQTKKDSLTIHYTEADLQQTISELKKRDVEWLRSHYDLGPDGRDWAVKWAKEDVMKSKGRVFRLQYRPFDLRYSYFTGTSKGFIAYPRKELTECLLTKNVALATMRQLAGVPDECEVLATTVPMTDRSMCSTLGTPYLFPLYCGTGGRGLLAGSDERPNYSTDFLKALALALKLRPQGEFDLPKGLGPEDIFRYAYAVFHSPGYRSRYAEFLKADFPRLPLTGDLELFRALARLGGKLVALHVLESPKLDRSLATYSGPANPSIDKVSHARRTVWLDKALTCGFHGVEEEVWNFRVGGYQVCEKWLKERKGRTLSKDDIAHYQKIVVAFSDTLRHMEEIDNVIAEHGGWPEAFTSVTSGGQ